MWTYLPKLPDEGTTVIVFGKSFEAVGSPPHSTTAKLKIYHKENATGGYTKVPIWADCDKIEWTPIAWTDVPLPGAG